MNTTEINVLDVTVLDPRMKHPTIFKNFDALDAGDSFIIHNDHDPKPLYYQLVNERGNTFQWKYLEEGPVWWKVMITKRKTDELNDETIGQIVSKDMRKAEVFKKFGIDFCCGGKKTIREACSEKGIDSERLTQELNMSGHIQAQRPQAYDEWALDFLADYVVATHHAYVKKNLPELRTYSVKVANVHGDAHPELVAIYQLIEAVNEELTQHMMKEENVLFPYIKNLVQAEKTYQAPQPPHFGSVRNPITMMELEHDTVGKLFDEIRILSDKYTLPEDACGSYTLLYKMLAEFEDDLHIHIHLENNILFPKAITLEKKLNS